MFETVHPYRVLRVCALGGFFVTVLIHYPGFMSTDSVNQLMQSRSGILSDWHPPLMSLIWGGVDAIISGPFGMMMIQVGLLWAGMYLIVSQLGIRSNWIAAVVILGSLLFFPVFTILGAVWKDIQMAGWLVLSFGLAMVCATLRTGDDRWRWIGVLALSVLALFLAMSMRHNAIGAAFGVAWFLGWSHLFLEWRVSVRFVLSGVVALALVGALFALVQIQNRAIADTHRSVEGFIFIFDIAGIAVKRGEIHALDRLKAEGLIKVKDLTIGTLKRHYRPRYHRNTMRVMKFDEASVAPLRRIWLDTVLRYPIAYLAHRWEVFKEIVGLTHGRDPRLNPDTRLPWMRVWMEPLPPHNLGGPAAVAKRLRHDYKLSALQKRAKEFFDRLALSVIYRPYVFLILGFITLAVGFVYLRRRMGIVFFLSVSGIGYQATIFLAAGATDYRFSHWMVLMSWLSALVIAALLVERQRRSGELKA